MILGRGGGGGGGGADGDSGGEGGVPFIRNSTVKVTVSVFLSASAAN